MNILKDIELLNNYLSDEKQNIELNVVEIGKFIIESFENNGKLISLGNGGSAADAQHIVCEFVGRFLKERKSLPAICLNTNVASLTSISNDFGYDEVFSRQIESLCSEYDIVLGYSTSGNSKNIIKAFEKCRLLNKKVKLISITGKSGGELKKISDYNFNVNLNSTPRIQEIHTLFNHLICDFVETNLRK